MIEWLGPVLYEFYGGSEGMGSTAIASTDWLAHPGSVGRATPGCAVHILDDAGRPCPPGVEGMVYFRNERQRFAYRGDPQKTAAAHRGELSTLGDIGYLDADGYLFLCDRRADLVISGGVNVYPAQIEAVLLEHAQVLDCCVVGLPDPEWGERLLALVIPRAGVLTDSQSVEDALRAHVRERLARYQQPREYVFVDSVPRTEAGKLLRRQVREQWRHRFSRDQ
jgi:long-chain acyl-CoA synthetase